MQGYISLIGGSTPSTTELRAKWIAAGLPPDEFTPHKALFAIGHEMPEPERNIRPIVTPPWHRPGA